MVQFSSALKRTMYNFKNSFFPNFLLIRRVKYIFSRDMFCLYHFKAKIHGVDSHQNCVTALELCFHGLNSEHVVVFLMFIWLKIKLDKQPWNEMSTWCFNSLCHPFIEFFFICIRKPMGKLRPISPYETALLDETLQEFILRKEKRYLLYLNLNLNKYI